LYVIFINDVVTSLNMLIKTINHVIQNSVIRPLIHCKNSLHINLDIVNVGVIAFTGHKSLLA